jgi:hypothetical protein
VLAGLVPIPAVGADLYYSMDSIMLYVKQQAPRWATVVLLTLIKRQLWSLRRKPAMHIMY